MVPGAGIRGEGGAAVQEYHCLEKTSSRPLCKLKEAKADSGPTVSGTNPRGGLPWNELTPKKWVRGVGTPLAAGPPAVKFGR